MTKKIKIYSIRLRFPLKKTFNFDLDCISMFEKNFLKKIILMLLIYLFIKKFIFWVYMVIST